MVFLDLRNLCRENSAVTLRDRHIATEDLAPVLGLFVEAIDGFFLAIKGGRRRGGFVEVWPGCVLRAGIISVAEAFSDDSSADEDGFEDQDNDAPDNRGDPLPDGDIEGHGTAECPRSRSRSPRRTVPPQGTGARADIGDAINRAGSRGSFVGNLWNRYVAAFVFLNAWVRGGSVILPCQEEDAWGHLAPPHAFNDPDWLHTGFEADWWMWTPTPFSDDGECPGADTPRKPSADASTTSCRTEPEREVFFGLELSELQTVLDAAKNDDLWALCDSLAWFLGTLNVRCLSLDCTLPSTARESISQTCQAEPAPWAL